MKHNAVGLFLIAAAFAINPVSIDAAEEGPGSDCGTIWDFYVEGEGGDRTWAHGAMVPSGWTGGTGMSDLTWPHTAAVPGEIFGHSEQVGKAYFDHDLC